jgi:hypothetical protein
MTGLRGDQVTDLVTAVFDLLDGVWQPVRGRRRVLGLHRAVVLTLFLMRRNEAQAVTGELFGCSQSTVSRIVRRLRPLLRQVTAEFAGQIRQQAKRSAASRRVPGPDRKPYRRARPPASATPPG